MRPKQGVFLVIVMLALSACAGMATRPGAQTAFETGYKLFNQGRYEEAIPYFQRSTDIDPEYWRGYFFLGRTYLNLKRWPEAIAPLRAAWRVSPEGMNQEIVTLLLDGLFGAATSALAAGEFRTSVGYFKDILDLQPQSTPARQQLVQAFIGLGGQMLSQGNYAAALEAYQEVVRLTPGNFDAYLGLARVHAQQGDMSQALRAAGEALRLAPANLEALRLLHRLQSQ